MKNYTKIIVNKLKCISIGEIIIFVFPVIAIYIIFTYVIAVTVVQSGSMEPILKIGNTVFYNRLAYRNELPRRGDIVLFYSDEYAAYFAKRIIGIPGDTILFENGQIYINGKLFDESDYIEDNVKSYGMIVLKNTTTNELTSMGQDFFVVPSNSYFMMGDNRENSDDSRYWDNPYIPYEKIIGNYVGQIDFSFQFDIFHDYPNDVKKSDLIKFN